MKWSKQFSLALLIAGLLCTSTYWVLYTNSGMNWYLNWVVSDNEATITIDGVMHRPDGQVYFKTLHYHHPKVDITFDALSSKLNLLTALAQQFEIEDFSAQKITVKLDSAASDWSKLRFPTPMRITTGTIKQFDLYNSNHRITQFNNIWFEQLYLHNNFYANLFAFDTISGNQFQLSGRLGFTNSSLINLTTKVIFKLPAYLEPINCIGTVVGNTTQVRFLQNVKTPYVITINGRLKNIAQNPEIEFSSNFNSTPNEKYFSKLNLENVTGTLTGKGDKDNFVLEANLSAETTTQQRWYSTLLSQINNKKLHFNFIANHTEQTKPTQAIVTGNWNIAFANEFPRSLLVNFKWTDFVLDVDDHHYVYSKKGSVSYDGDKREASVDARGVSLANLDPAISHIKLTVQAMADNLIAVHGYAHTSDGNVNISAGYVMNDNQNYQLDNLSVIGLNEKLVQKFQTISLSLADIDMTTKNISDTAPLSKTQAELEIPLENFSGVLHQIISLAQNGTTHNTID